jgi:inosine/guanosine/xanthosine phosphorylase family protein
VQVKVALIAGSGLRAVTDRIQGQRRTWTPGAAPRPPAPGHLMEVVEGTLGGVPALGFAGRLHYYQGYSMAEVTQAVAEAHAWGAGVLFVTNASGSLRTELAVGEVTVVSDHINLLPDNPLRGSAEFLDLSEAYDRDLRLGLAEVAAAQALRVPEVVYVALPGPSFETPAEARMLRVLGGDVVGMSTVPEVIAARRLGMRVLALSVVANRAGSPATAQDVLQAASARATDVADLLQGVTLNLR